MDLIPYIEKVGKDSVWKNDVNLNVKHIPFFEVFDEVKLLIARYMSNTTDNIHFLIVDEIKQDNID